jgi:Toluene-4-monooxygenase system protein B (TmoB)
VPIPYHTVTEGDAYSIIVLADDDDTVEEFAPKVAYHSIGRRVPAVPGARLVLRHGDTELSAKDRMADVVPAFQRLDLIQVPKKAKRFLK